MYTLLKKNEVKKITRAEIPSLFAALIFTETVYHFGSFILECSAFLATWFAISYFINRMLTFSPKNGEK